MKMQTPENSESLQSLKTFMNNVPIGPVKEPERLGKLLAKCWEELARSDHEAMAGFKLKGRMESVHWDPPNLTFEIERHGPTCVGSTYANVHRWRVDLSGTSAAIIGCWRRQVRRPEPEFDTVKPAAKLALAIRTHRNSRWLQWNPDGSVKVLIKKIIPQHTAKLTIETRTRRFKTQLANLLAEHGWEMVHKLQSARCEFRLKSPTASAPV